MPHSASSPHTSLHLLISPAPFCYTGSKRRANAAEIYRKETFTMSNLPKRCPVCGQPYASGSSYCTICKKELTETKQNRCLNSDCPQHTAYLPVGLTECPDCHGPTSNAEQINKMV